jgi:hypothetical protein
MTMRTYKDILQLRGETIHNLLTTRAGLTYAMKLFVVVTLIAGLGKLAGLPLALQQPTMLDRVNGLATDIERFGGVLGTSVVPAIVNGNVLEIPNQLRGQLQSRLADLTAVFTGGADQAAALPGEASAAANAAVDRLLAQANVTPEQIEQAVQQGEVTAGQLKALLERARPTAAQTDAILSRAGVSRSQVDAAVAAVSSEIAQLKPLMERLNLSEAQLRAILDRFAATPEQLSRWLDRVNLSPEQFGDLVQRLEATPEQLDRLAADIRTEAELLEPPLGTQFSAVLRVFGGWLATPLQVLGEFLLFGLVLLIAAKILGGRATLPRHIGALALASAPLVLLLVSFIPDLSPVVSPFIAAAIRIFGRVLALIALVWCAGLVVKSLAQAHEFSLARSAGAVILAGAIVLIVVPAATAFALGFLLRPF